MPSVEELTDPHLSTYCVVPPVGPGICAICHGAPMKKQYRTCISCDKTLKQVSRPTRLVVPISLYRVGLQLHKVLRGYKDEPIDKLRESFFLQVAALLHRFIRDHRGCIARAAGVDWNVITSIPSSQGRAGQHPLEQAIRLSKLLG